MKKNLSLFMILLAVVLVISCATGKTADKGSRRVDSRVPKFVREAVDNTPEDTLIGIGTANMASLGQSRTISATRARAEISRQMETIIQDMIRDYTAGSELDHSAVLSFQENITVALSQSRLQGATIINEDYDEAGNYWTVVALNKNGVVNEINQAVSASKLRVPQMASFDAEARMEAAIERHNSNSELGYADN